MKHIQYLLTAVLFLLFIHPLETYSQKITGYGLKFGYATNTYGWVHPDPVLDTSYYQPTSLTFQLGLYGEFLNRRFISTNVNWGIKFKSTKFNYPVYNELREVVGTSSVKNDVTWTTIAITERFRLPYQTWLFYVYGGFEGSFRIGKNISAGFENVFDNSKKQTFSISSGIGIAKGMDFFLFSLEFYFNPDLTKSYTSNSGYMRNTELGLRLGFGLFDADNMLK